MHLDGIDLACILTDIHNNEATNMAEPRVHKYVKIRKSANDKVQELADRKHNGNWHAAIRQIIEESKA